MDPTTANPIELVIIVLVLLVAIGTAFWIVKTVIKPVVLFGIVAVIGWLLYANNMGLGG
jgi:hypothetical protein